jgi:hypothetical protein
LTFGTLLSSQRTDAAFGCRFRPLRAFPSLSCVSDSIRRFPVPDPQSAGLVFPAVGPFRRVRL